MGIGKLKVVLTEEAQAFLDAQPFKAQQKIFYNIFKVEEGVMKVNIFKKLENTDIWEFRTLYNGISYRLFSFWDTELDTLVIVTLGIVKKTQKAQSKEIAKAEEVRKEYFKTRDNSIMEHMKLIPADDMKDKLNKPNLEVYEVPAPKTMLEKLTETSSKTELGKIITTKTGFFYLAEIY